MTFVDHTTNTITFTKVDLIAALVDYMNKNNINGNFEDGFTVLSSSTVQTLSTDPDSTPYITIQFPLD